MLCKGTASQAAEKLIRRRIRASARTLWAAEWTRASAPEGYCLGAGASR